jgi:quercetin dioxygenase-like cupin family protein
MRLIDTGQNLIEKRPGWTGCIFSSDAMTFAHWRFTEGAEIHAHSHEQEEVWHIVEGRLELTADGEIVQIGPGQVAILAAHAIHKVSALTDGYAIVADHPLRPGFEMV